MSQEIPQDVTKTLQEIGKITSDYLETISKAISPHKLDELIREIRPRSAYVLGGGKDWYEYIEEGQGLHGEVLSVLSQTDCNTLKRLALLLGQQVSPLLSKGVGSPTRKMLSSYNEKLRSGLEENVAKTLDEISAKAQDIEAQTQGFADRTRKNYVYRKMTNQIQSVYDLGNIVERLRGELPLVLPAPSLVVNSTTNIEVRKEATRMKSKNVFIVHGRDESYAQELKTMLFELGLKPIILHEKASGGLTIAEKIEKYSGDCSYAFVLLTPDDVGCLKEELDRIVDQLYSKKNYISIPPERTLTLEEIITKISKVMENRARQNVVLEFGYFMGLLGRKNVCCLYKGNIELPSDMGGIVYMKFTQSLKEQQVMIMKELREAGFEIDF